MAFERPRGARGIAPLIVAALAAGAARTGVGILTGHKEADRQRDLIYQAYDRGQQRLGVRQGDVRQGQTESLIARGLNMGGDTGTGGPVAPGANLGVGGAHTLGGQQQVDLRREQGLEQNEMLAERNQAIDDVGHSATQAGIDSVASGVKTGMSVYSAGTEFGAGGGAAGGATPMGTKIGTIHGAFGVDPLTGEGMPSTKSNFSFNKYS